MFFIVIQKRYLLSLKTVSPSPLPEHEVHIGKYSRIRLFLFKAHNSPGISLTKGNSRAASWLFRHLCWQRHSVGLLLWVMPHMLPALRR